MTRKTLRRIAHAFRAAAEAVTPLPQTFASLNQFPQGCCKATSFLLARFLDKRHGIADSIYVSGDRPGQTPFTPHIHGWLEIQGYIVDLTADQFEEVSESVLVVERGHSPFHSDFLDQSHDPYPRFWDGFRSEASADFERTYAAIVSKLEN